MLIALAWKKKGAAASGISLPRNTFCKQRVALLGFGLNLAVVAQTGWQSLPIIVVTITSCSRFGWLMSKALRMTSNTATLIGVGSSICGGSAIAATAPVIKARDEE